MFGGKNSKNVPKARKAKKTARPARKSAAPAPARRKKSEEELASARRTRGFVIGTVAFAAVGMGSTVGLDWLDARAEQKLDARPVTVSVAWADWLPTQSQRDVRTLVLEALGAIEVIGDDATTATSSVTQATNQQDNQPEFTVSGSLSTAPLRRVSQQLADSGWFESAPTVRRGTDGAIEVNGAWRTPAVWVRHNGNDRIVDWQGRPMPYADRATAEVDRSLPLVLGVSRGPVRSGASNQPLWNELWAPEEIGAALALLRELYEHDLVAQVRAIDLSRLARATEVSIVTDRGSVIVWGAPPGAWRPEDTRTTADKLSVLTDHIARTGRLDANERVVEIYGPFTVANDAP